MANSSIYSIPDSRIEQADVKNMWEATKQFTINTKWGKILPSQFFIDKIQSYTKIRDESFPFSPNKIAIKKSGD